MPCAMPPPALTRRLAAQGLLRPWILAAFLAVMATVTAWAQGDPQLAIQPAETALGHPPPRTIPLDLTLRSNRLATPYGQVRLFAGGTLVASRAAPAAPGLAPPDPDLRSRSDLFYVGMQFDNGARLRIKRSGDGIKVTYRASF